ncbi:2OG-Fe(II) oxygenase [Formosa sp. PL04]|uniref:2OG-Fe(II) oxygenase n=1 Tax=Formosa sp. PL04 TaxID=3081755 RepID=UPI002981DDB9|nr:2OG-Fe(II) oxygenase [Formosa sp. PL04]MDW5287564.1 2OG-Fe(II) oxygenase [Formosa sp. PL04]
MNKDSIDRNSLSKLIIDRLIAEKESLKLQFNDSKDKIGYFYIDTILPVDIATEIHNQFPSPEDMTLKKSLREYKHVAAQMNKYNPILEEAIYAFQDEKIVRLVREICEIDDLYPDEKLYAGGISAMHKDQFLNPHLDNSHDKDRNRWRVLNLLYYVSPDWKDDNGGHLELWPNGLDKPQTVVHSKFNRLIVMATHQASWHSVSPVTADASRQCVSNYYFSDSPLQTTDSFHVTTFRGRPEQKLTNQVLKIDSFLRMNIRKIFKKGIVENPHVYKKEE